MKKLLTAAVLICSLSILKAQNVGGESAPQPVKTQQDVPASLYSKYDYVKLCDLADWTPSNMEVKGSSQGFAVCGKYAVQLHDKGQFLIIDLEKKKVVSSFFVEGNLSHNNNCNFASAKYFPESDFPLLYVSECKEGHACYVTDLNLDGGKIVQWIYYDDSDCKGNIDWAIDDENGFIWAIQGDGPRQRRYMSKFRLPKLEDSDAAGCVHLTRADILEEINLPTIDVGQGIKIRGGKAYFTDGIPKYGHVGLHVMDLSTGKDIAYYDFVPTINLEPEGLDLVGDEIWVAFHVKKQPRHTTIYKIKIL